MKNPRDLLDAIDEQITAYDALPKDDCAHFSIRATRLARIAALCKWYRQSLGATHRLSTKQAAGKRLNDPIDVWVHSLGRRALKKSGYLNTMDQWHANAKAKYKDRVQLSSFLRQLAYDNTSHGGEKLHATPYATIEKMDPYHRQTFVFLDPMAMDVSDTTNDQEHNEMGLAFLEYLAGGPASGYTTNNAASFYEWLECHPFCVGTPGLLGDDRYRSPPRISYEGHNLGLVHLPPNQMTCEKILTDNGTCYVLNTKTDFGKSGKGPDGAAAFVWDGDGNLWLHEHGADGFIHASVKQGKKVRCSGMFVAKNGKATYVTNESGHYAPNAQSIYNFVSWLHQRGVLEPLAQVEIKHDDNHPTLNGTFDQRTFRLKAGGLLGQPSLTGYLV
jgi:hypothetical protein